MKIKFYILYLVWFLIYSGTIFSETKLKSLHIQGNHHFSKREILKWSGLKKGEPLIKEQLITGLKLILDGFAQKGYYFSTIDSLKFNYFPDSSRTTLTIFLTEGPRLRLTSVTVMDSNSVIQPELTNVFPHQKVFTIQQLEAGIEDIIGDFEEAGFPFAMVELKKIDSDNSTNIINLQAVLSVRPGFQVTLAGIEVRGNIRTRSKFILRESRLKSGTLFSPQSFELAQRRLERTGLFDEVKPFELLRRNDHFFALIKVKEAKNNSLSGAMGYVPGEDNKKGYWSGQVDFAFNNLLGMGRKFQLHWYQPNKSSQDISFSYTEPWVAGMPFAVKFSLWQSMRSVSGFTLLGGDNRFITRNANIDATSSISETINLNGGITYDEVLPDSTSRYVLGIPHTLAWGLQGGIILDSRDNAVNPKEGFLYCNTIKVVIKKNYVASNSILPQKVEEKRLELEFESAFSLNRWSVIDFRLSGRRLQSPQILIPISEMYFLGGTNSLRGYREQQFPGTSIAWSNLEYRWLVGKYSRLFLFSDWGYYYRQENESNSDFIEIDEFKIGYGAGIMLETEVGSINITFGLGKGESFLQGKLHIKLETQF
jgi:outer membrane protein insertion porin family